MTRLNADNVAAFLSVETTSLDSPAPRTQRDAEPFDAFLQRAGRSADAGAENGERSGEGGPARPDDSGPSDTRSDADRRDAAKSTEPDREAEKAPNPSETPADAGNVASDRDQPEAVDTEADDETDDQPDAANGESPSEDTQVNQQAAALATEIASAGNGQETGEEDELPADENRSRKSQPGTRNRHDSHENRRGTDQAAKSTATSERSEQMGQDSG